MKRSKRARCMCPELLSSYLIRFYFVSSRVWTTVLGRDWIIAYTHWLADGIFFSVKISRFKSGNSGIIQWWIWTLLLDAYCHINREVIKTLTAASSPTAQSGQQFRQLCPLFLTHPLTFKLITKQNLSQILCVCVCKCVSLFLGVCVCVCVCVYVFVCTWLCV